MASSSSSLPDDVVRLIFEFASTWKSTYGASHKFRDLTVEYSLPHEMKEILFQRSLITRHNRDAELILRRTRLRTLAPDPRNGSKIYVHIGREGIELLSRCVGFDMLVKRGLFGAVAKGGNYEAVEVLLKKGIVDSYSDFNKVDEEIILLILSSGVSLKCLEHRHYEAMLDPDHNQRRILSEMVRNKDAVATFGYDMFAYIRNQSPTLTPIWSQEIGKTNFLALPSDGVDCVELLKAVHKYGKRDHFVHLVRKFFFDVRRFRVRKEMVEIDPVMVGSVVHLEEKDFNSYPYDLGERIFIAQHCCDVQTRHRLFDRWYGEIVKRYVIESILGLWPKLKSLREGDFPPEEFEEIAYDILGLDQGFSTVVLDDDLFYTRATMNYCLCAHNIRDAYIISTRLHIILKAGAGESVADHARKTLLTMERSQKGSRGDNERDRCEK
jgi:hypothetical protein